ncbi:hypothetical protein [Mesonia maritima]|uniref:GIY-YIG domain-containing protein n=1 Tax=Mesonia maritima TaxID=1793873 RepID=A0ABU1K4A6_9FLAO|nr:hypothetical protein [Mesonia maritima]MDR6299413.1 hypothetical protein [Mesonia maritima]
MELGYFKIPGHSTKRNWAVYIFVAKPKKKDKRNYFYVGKVGDNRDGCNPVISRVGNHFSYNKVHSQIRNSISNTENYDYEYFYCHFDKYDSKKELRIRDREKINELERELNRIVQVKLDKSKSILLNPYVGNHISKKEKERRAKILTTEEKAILLKLCEKAL